MRAYVPRHNLSIDRELTTIDTRLDYPTQAKADWVGHPAVLLQVKTVRNAPDEKSCYGVANKRDGCTMVPFSRPKRKVRMRR
jgi:hypothetical protein